MCMANVPIIRNTIDRIVKTKQTPHEPNIQ